MRATLDTAQRFQQEKMVPCKTDVAENADSAFILRY
jgi:hypothetical protein